MSTYFPKEGEIARKWYVVDAAGQTLGRLASQVARILMGKESPQYTPFLDTGDHVIVINAEKVEADRHEVGAEGVSPLHRISGRVADGRFPKRFDRKPELIIEARGVAHAPQERNWATHMFRSSMCIAARSIRTRRRSQEAASAGVAQAAATS